MLVLIVCTADDGRTWRTIYDSDKIHYITGFHFHPSGAVYISSYGHGLWQLKATRGCPRSYDFPWDVRPDFSVGAGEVGVIARDAPPHAPSALAAADRPKLFVTLEESEPRTQRERLVIAGRGFAPGQDLILLCREFESLKIPARADQTGQFVITLPLPQSFPYGAFTLEANGAGVKLTSSEVLQIVFGQGALQTGSRHR